MSKKYRDGDACQGDRFVHPARSQPDGEPPFGGIANERQQCGRLIARAQDIRGTRVSRAV